MYKFGKKSSEELQTIHHDLQKVFKRALSYSVMDFSVTQGKRTIKEQQRLFREGKSRIDGVQKKGKHNYNPSLAGDVMPYPVSINGVNVWNDKQRFCVLAGLIFAAAAEENVKIRWGGDWDGDGNNADSSFYDLPHFELVT